MPLNLAALAYDTTAVTVDFGDAGTLNLTWSAGKLTPALQSELVHARDNSDAMAIARTLATLIVTWDVETDGVAAPITEAFLGSLPVKVLGDVFAAMSASVTVGEAIGAT